MLQLLLNKLKSYIGNNGYIEYIVYCTGLFSTMTVLRFANHNFSWFFSVLLTGILLFKKTRYSGKVFEPFFLFFLITLLITERLHIVHCISTISLYVIALQYDLLSRKQIDFFIKGLKHSCLIQLVWCGLQYVMFLGNVDLNDLIFNQTLHLVDRASFGTALTGLGWHPCNLIPVLLLAVILFDKWLIWVFCLFIAINAKSSTTILALLMALVTSFYFKKYHLTLHIKLNMSRVIIFSAAAVALVVILISIYPLLFDEIDRLKMRIISSDDTSTMLHKRYYTKILYVWSNVDLFTVLFGCGYNRSGNIFSELFNQYSWMDFWAVESDPMNILYGNGILGFIFFYGFLIFEMIKSYRNDKASFRFFLIMTLCGIAYNCQFEWVIQIELILAILIQKRIPLNRASNELFKDKNMRCIYE